MQQRWHATFETNVETLLQSNRLGNKKLTLPCSMSETHLKHNVITINYYSLIRFYTYCFKTYCQSADLLLIPHDKYDNAIRG